MEKGESDHRSVYVGDVSPGGLQMGPLQMGPRVSHLLRALTVKERDTGPGGEKAEDGT